MTERPSDDAREAFRQPTPAEIAEKDRRGRAARAAMDNYLHQQQAPPKTESIVEEAPELPARIEDLGPRDERAAEKLRAIRESLSGVSPSSAPLNEGGSRDAETESDDDQGASDQA